MTSVAVVGTGRMGSAVARALSRGGVDLVLYNRSRDTARALAQELGARVAVTPAEAAMSVDIAITMLADGEAVRMIWGGGDGLAAGAHAGGVLIDASTVPPGTIEAFEQVVRSHGSGIVDAPVSGSTHLAEAGQLTIMAGGTAADLDRALPALTLISKQITHVGPLGSGAALKLAVNAMIFATNNSLSEALVLAEQAGLDRTVAYDVFVSSAAGAPYVAYKRDAFLDPDSQPVAFSLALALKDLRLITDFARQLGVPMPQTRLNHDIIAAAAREWGAEQDASVVSEYLRHQVGEARPL